MVVGAGPAGSSAAYSAAKLGCKVALVEKERVVAETVRTSGVTWIDYCNEFGIPKDCYNPIRTYKFCSPKNKATITNKSFNETHTHTSGGRHRLTAQAVRQYSY